MTLNVPQSQTPKTTRLRDLCALRERPLPHAEGAESAEACPLREGRWGLSPIGRAHSPGAPLTHPSILTVVGSEKSVLTQPSVRGD